MKKVVSLLIFLLAIASCICLVYLYKDYENTKDKNNNSILEQNKKIESLNKEHKELEEKLNKIKEENKDKIMEYEKWQKDVEEVKAYLQ